MDIKQIFKEKNPFEGVIFQLEEDYPSSFDMEEFEKLTSFNKRIKYCEEHLKRISSGSSRIVYQIDNKKVLKLSKNKKGLAQTEVEVEYSGYYDISDIVAQVFNYDTNYLWIEMELARKLRPVDFKRITGFNWKDYQNAIHNHGINSGNARGNKQDVDKSTVEDMWEDEFVYSMFDFIGSYGVPTGDLTRLSSYGIVSRDGEDMVVLIDYGLTHDVYGSYYS